jgi:hypothetical protein
VFRHFKRSRTGLVVEDGELNQHYRGTSHLDYFLITDLITLLKAGL